MSHAIEEICVGHVHRSTLGPTFRATDMDRVSSIHKIQGSNHRFNPALFLSFIFKIERGFSELDIVDRFQ